MEFLPEEKENEDMEKFSFKDGALQKLFEERASELQALTDESVNDKAYLWDKTVKRYAVAMERTKRVLSADEVNGYITAGMMRKVNAFLEQCANEEFHIALVGTIKAGKSTLINAMLGHEYASTKVTPETASLTKFRKGEENYVKVTFYTKQEWEKLWKSAEDSKATVFREEYYALHAETEKDRWVGESSQIISCGSEQELVEEIKRWTSSKSSVHYFVKEVEVGLQEFGLPKGVILVDTPGLDDAVAYRSDITRDYIARANAVMVCVKSDALTGSEVHTISSVFSNTRYCPEKVYIIATQLDTLNNPKENWKEQREEWLKYLKGKSAYNSRQLAEKNLMPVSAYLHILLAEKAYDQAEESDMRWELDSVLHKLRVRDVHENIQQLYEFTGIQALNKKLEEEIVAKYKEMMVQDIENSYYMCREEILEAIKKVKKEQNEIIKASQGGIEEIKKKQMEFTQKYEDAKKDKKELEGLISKLQYMVKKRADELEESIQALGR